MIFRLVVLWSIMNFFKYYCTIQLIPDDEEVNIVKFWEMFNVDSYGWAAGRALAAEPSFSMCVGMSPGTGGEWSLGRRGGQRKGQRWRRYIVVVYRRHTCLLTNCQRDTESQTRDTGIIFQLSAKEI